jgi:hypothetical protein
VAQLLFVGFFLVLFVVAPVKAAGVFLGAFLLAALVVQATAASVCRASVTLADSIKAIVYAFFFAAVAIFTLFSFMVGAPRELLTNPAVVAAAGWPLVALQYGAFVLGFKLALGLSFLQACVVSIASTAITSGALWFISRMASGPG